jgi:CBS domain-containing protein
MHGSPHIVSDVMTRTVATVGRGGLQGHRAHDAGAEGQRPARARRGGAGDRDRLGGDLLPKEEFRDDDPDRHTQLRRLSDLAKAGSVTAGELMTAPALTVGPGATLAQAARTMARAKVRAGRP